eukprot:11171752-Lingulodinium_polyedra.AAC.1
MQQQLEAAVAEAEKKKSLQDDTSECDTLISEATALSNDMAAIVAIYAVLSVLRSKDLEGP